MMYQLKTKLPNQPISIALRLKGVFVSFPLF